MISDMGNHCLVNKTVNYSAGRFWVSFWLKIPTVWDFELPIENQKIGNHEIYSLIFSFEERNTTERIKNYTSYTLIYTTW